MEISMATVEDIPQLCELLALLFDQEAEFRPDSALHAEGVRQIIEFPERGRILALREGQSVIGMVNLLYTVSTPWGGGSQSLKTWSCAPIAAPGEPVRCSLRQPWLLPDPPAASA